jgi:pilus assembly protein CpaB
VRPPSFLEGPVPPLPRPVDALARLWAGVSGRTRLLVRLVGAVLVLTAATGGLVRGPWGTPTTVLVAATAIAPGAPVTPADVRVGRWPSALVPADALTEPASLPTDAVAAGPLAAGAVVTTAAVTAGPAGLAADGTAVVAVDATLLPALPVGTVVDVAVPAVDGTASIAARGAVVVADDGTWRWLRVARGDVAPLAAGISSGQLVPAVLPRPGPAGEPSSGR